MIQMKGIQFIPQNTCCNKKIRGAAYPSLLCCSDKIIRRKQLKEEGFVLMDAVHHGRYLTATGTAGQ